MPLVGDTAPLERVFEACVQDMERRQTAMLREKLGLRAVADDSTGPDPLLDELHEVLTLVETDMTIFFRRLQTSPAPAER